MSTRPTVHSLYWQNVAPAILNAQRSAFAHLGIPLVQDLQDGMAHGAWMDDLLARAGDDLLVICDIDAVPLNAAAFDRLVAFAQDGRVAGLAQTSNHLEMPDKIYAGPMFLALRRSVWRDLGCPSMAPSKQYDAGQLLSRVAEERGVPVEVVLPNTCLKPMWNLAGRRVFGIGTFYGENDFFHLFQSRKKRNIRLFQEVCADMVAGKSHDFGRYLVTLNGKRRMPKILRRYFG
jgi:hypothetical protein